MEKTQKFDVLVPYLLYDNIKQNSQPFCLLITGQFTNKKKSIIKFKKLTDLSDNPIKLFNLNKLL